MSRTLGACGLWQGGDQIMPWRDERIGAFNLQFSRFSSSCVVCETLVVHSLEEVWGLIEETTCAQEEKFKYFFHTVSV